MALILNTKQHGNTTYRVALGENNYNIRLYWNTRNETWGMDIAFANGIDIAKGITLVPNISLLEPYTYKGFTGYLVLSNVKQDDTEIGYDNFGVGESYRLVWFSEEEISGTD